MEELTKKERAIREVLEKRISVLREKVLPNVKDDKNRYYYAGKIAGFQQAYDLLGETFESIIIEL